MLTFPGPQDLCATVPEALEAQLTKVRPWRKPSTASILRQCSCCSVSAALHPFP